MLLYAFIFLVIALIAAALGFPAIAGIAYGVARIFFFIFVVLFCVFLVLAIFTTHLYVVP